MGQGGVGWGHVVPNIDEQDAKQLHRGEAISYFNYTPVAQEKWSTTTSAGL